MHSYSYDNCQLCISLGASTFQVLLEQVQQARQWADLIEIRLDKLLSLADLNAASLLMLEKRASCPLIWTLRKASQGGNFVGTEEERFLFLQWILKNSQPALMDIEADTPSYMIQTLQALYPHTRWIISWHDEKKTPQALDALYQKISAYPATYYKIATFAHTTCDALRMLNFSQNVNHTKRLVCGICMGERGQLTRILANRVGQPLTFAALEPEKLTARGQLSAQEMLTLYHFRHIDQHTKIYGLIGEPVDKSPSHVTHNAVFRALGFNGVYLKFHVQPDELTSFFNEITTLPIEGLSVTMPFKEKVLFLLDPSQALKACNTLVKTSRGWQGFNTDGKGAIKALQLAACQMQKVVILGAGGTAHAIAEALHQQGAQLAILNRTIERAKKLAIPLNAKWGALNELPALIQAGYTCVIQATSVGMGSDQNATPIPVDWLTQEICLLEVIAPSSPTLLLSEAKKRGGIAISGQELFVHQAVEQFVHWIGASISHQRVEMTIRQHLPSKLPSFVRIRQSHLSGTLQLPPSKSHTIRAILLGAFAEGISLIHHPLDSPDTNCAIQAVCQWGAKVTALATGWAIQGVAGYPSTPSQIIDAGNSGQVLRFVGALATLAQGYTVITGDESIRAQRSIQPLIEGLKGLHACALSTRDNGYAPMIVKGPLKPGCTQLEGQDSQPVSALLMAAAFTEGEFEIEVRSAGEKPWLALTLAWLDRLKVQYNHHNLEHFIIQGQRQRPAFEMTIPGDLSALAFPLAAAIVTGSELIIQQADLQDVQGDKAFVFLIQQMGIDLEIDASQHLIKVLAQGQLKGQIIDVNDFIDAVPILAVLGCYAEGETQLVNAAIARQKESNRLACITSELKKMGAIIEETEDGLKIQSSRLKGACVNSYGDHRIAMALIVAGLGAEGETRVQQVECIRKSYPTFLKDLQDLGAYLDEETC